MDESQAQAWTYGLICVGWRLRTEFTRWNHLAFRPDESTVHVDELEHDLVCSARFANLTYGGLEPKLPQARAQRCW